MYFSAPVSLQYVGAVRGSHGATAVPRRNRRSRSNAVSAESFHPPFDRLADLVEEHLPPDDEPQLHAHLALCPYCANEVAWLERTIELMRTDESEDAPSHVIARAVHLLLLPGADDVPSRWRRVLATLRFDSGQAPLALAVRGPQLRTRQLLYGAEECDLDLRITPVGDRWSVSGQLLGPDGSGRVELHGAGGVVQATTALSDLGEFVLPPVSSGGYTLRLRAGDLEVEVTSLDLGAGDEAG